ncbi:MAG: hypothetical protein ABH983_01515 [Candidatus Micrarchaeota archaeon]
MPKTDEEAITLFLNDFVNQLTSIYPSEIQYIILAGSASRGDFVLGKSDLDMGIIIKETKNVAKVKKSALEIFWKLDAKQNMKFKQSLSVPNGQKPPFDVVGPEGNPKKRDLFALISPFFGYQRAMLQHTVRYGKILYGDDSVLKLFKKRYSKWGLFKILFSYDLFLSIFSVFSFFIDPDQSLRRSTRALLYTFEDDLSHPLFKKASLTRLNFDKIIKEWSVWRKFSFCLSVPFSVLSKIISEVWKRFKIIF